MVIRYVLAIIFCILLSSVQARANVSLDVQLTDQRIEFGKSTLLTLTSPLSQVSLDNFSLLPLQTDFYIDSSADVVVSEHQQHKTLRLYPRRPGQLTIPALQFQGLTSTALELIVTAPYDSKTGHTLNISHIISGNEAWQNQQVSITFTIQSKDQYVDLQTHSADTATGILYTSQPESLYSDNAELWQHRIAWHYFPTQVGQQTVELPPVLYRRDGIVTHRFYLLAQKLTVKPLPFYVPVNYPLGRLSLQVEAPRLFMLTNRLQMLNVSLAGTGLLPQTLPNIEHLLQSQASFQIYPAQSSLIHTTDIETMRSVSKLQIPVKANSTGIYQLPDLILSFFDPETGKIHQVNYQWPALYFISPWLLGLLLLLCFIIVYLGVKRLATFVISLIHRQRVIRRARQGLQSATTATEINQALLLYASVCMPDSNATISQLTIYRDVDNEALLRALYAGDDDQDVDYLKRPYLSVLSRR